jgi:hypothetical protein
VPFDWASHGLSVTSTVYDLAEGARVLWGGTATGITGVHEWLFSQTPAGVRVTTNESLAGEPVTADAAGLQSLLDAALCLGSFISRQPPSQGPDHRPESSGPVELDLLVPPTFSHTATGGG